jgi:hypothetical protein
MRVSRQCGSYLSWVVRAPVVIEHGAVASGPSPTFIGSHTSLFYTIFFAGPFFRSVFFPPFSRCAATPSACSLIFFWSVVAPLLHHRQQYDCHNFSALFTISRNHALPKAPCPLPRLGCTGLGPRHSIPSCNGSALSPRNSSPRCRHSSSDH